MKALWYLTLLVLMIGRADPRVSYTRLRPAAPGNSNAYRLVVAADGSGDTTSVQQAIDRVPEFNAHRFVIHIKPGTYKEQLKISQTRPFITFEGEDSLKTLVTYNLSAKTSGDTRNSYTAYIGGSDFRAENITFENTYGLGSQAVAVYVNTDRVVFRNCRFLGWQDTLFAHGGRQYYKDCYIEGHVDFIFGNSTSVFENCTIHSKGRGYVTAPWALSGSETNGLIFRNCKLTGAPDSPSYLGRPWRPYGRTIFIDCWMDAHIRPEGWDNWRDPAREKTARFGEYRSRGPGANPAARVVWAKQLTEQESRIFATRTFLHGVDNWNPYKW
jgi:pectinesterase